MVILLHNLYSPLNAIHQTAHNTYQMDCRLTSSPFDMSMAVGFPVSQRDWQCDRSISSEHTRNLSWLMVMIKRYKTVHTKTRQILPTLSIKSYRPIYIHNLLIMTKHLQQSININQKHVNQTEIKPTETKTIAKTTDNQKQYALQTSMLAQYIQTQCPYTVIFHWPMKSIQELFTSYDTIFNGKPYCSLLRFTVCTLHTQDKLHNIT